MFKRVPVTKKEFPKKRRLAPDQTQAMLLGKQVDEALQLLTEYNGRLAKEMEDRKTLTKLLLDYTAAQKELLVQAEERLQEYKEKLAKVYQVREELHSHIQSLPDISQLPNVSAGLAPLPSAGDLFSLRWSPSAEICSILYYPPASFPRRFISRAPALPIPPLHFCRVHFLFLRARWLCALGFVVFLLPTIFLPWPRWKAMLLARK